MHTVQFILFPLHQAQILLLLQHQDLFFHNVMLSTHSAPFPASETGPAPYPDSDSDTTSAPRSSWFCCFPVKFLRTHTFFASRSHLLHWVQALILPRYQSVPSESILIVNLCTYSVSPSLRVCVVDQADLCFLLIYFLIFTRFHSLLTVVNSSS